DVEAYFSTSKIPAEGTETFAGSTRAFARGRAIDRFLLVRPTAPYVHLRIHGESSQWRTVGSFSPPEDVEFRTSVAVRRVYSVSF
ncbi:hypothetical protein C1Y10_29480, partial [Pseudomonas sp. FW305-122]|uniref:hypothetical protein n=1 Tax=Pseudomonas sp. FW305-122 TaxID=2070561 RepID=UPI000CB2447F